jgi:hypothetical protein
MFGHNSFLVIFSIQPFHKLDQNFTSCISLLPPGNCPTESFSYILIDFIRIFEMGASWGRACFLSPNIYLSTFICWALSTFSCLILIIFYLFTTALSFCLGANPPTFISYSLLKLCPVYSKLGHVADGLLHVVVEGVHRQVDEEDPVRMLGQVLVPPVIRIREI